MIELSSEEKIHLIEELDYIIVVLSLHDKQYEQMLIQSIIRKLRRIKDFLNNKLSQKATEQLEYIIELGQCTVDQSKTQPIPKDLP